MGLKEKIMQSAVRHMEPVQAFGQQLYIKQLNVGEYAALERRLLQIDDNAGALEVAMVLVAHTLCDESGDRIFSDTEMDQIGELSRQQIMRLNKIAERLNRIGEEQVDDAAKN